MDRATLTLLKYLVIDEQPISQSIEKASNEAGVDPQYDSFLDSYPLNRTQTLLEFWKQETREKPARPNKYAIASVYFVLINISTKGRNDDEKKPALKPLS